MNTESKPNSEGEGSLVSMWLVIFVFPGIIIYLMLRRISRTEDLNEDSKGMSLYGVVTEVQDGDGFRFFHCPWLRSKSYTEVSGLYVRLAGIDAPEMGNSKVPKQFYAEESKKYLESLILGKNIKIRVVEVDQYNRVLASAYLPRWFPSLFSKRWFPAGLFFPVDFLYTNVNLEMVKNGCACVYTGRDAKYDGYEEKLISLEEEARNEKRGMWRRPNSRTPMEHKRIYRNR